MRLRRAVGCRAGDRRQAASSECGRFGTWRCKRYGPPGHARRALPASRGRRCPPVVHAARRRWRVMGRPPLPIGTHGEMTVARAAGRRGRFRARTGSGRRRRHPAGRARRNVTGRWRAKCKPHPLLLTEQSWAGLRVQLALDRPRVDGDVGTIAIEGMVICVPGHGLIVQPRTTSDAGTRTVRPPAQVIELLRKRPADPPGPWVFPSTRGTLRDPDNTQAARKGRRWHAMAGSASAPFPTPRRDRAGRRRPERVREIATTSAATVSA